MRRLIKDEARYGCGSGIFFVESEHEYLDICVAHDKDYEKGVTVWDWIKADAYFVGRTFLKVLDNIWDVVRGLLYIAIVVAFGWLFFVIGRAKANKIRREEGNKTK